MCVGVRVCALITGICPHPRRLTDSKMFELLAGHGCNTSLLDSLVHLECGSSRNRGERSTELYTHTATGFRNASDPSQTSGGDAYGGGDKEDDAGNRKNGDSFAGEGSADSYACKHLNFEDIATISRSRRVRFSFFVTFC